MAQKKRKQGEHPDWRINIKLLTEDEVHLYWEMKARANRKGMTLHDFVMALFRKEADRKDADSK